MPNPFAEARGESGLLAGLKALLRAGGFRLRAAAQGDATVGPQFLALFDAMPQLGWSARPDGFIDYYNRGWYEYTGTTYEQMQGWGWQSVHDPQLLPSVMERWQRSIEIGVPFEMEFTLRSRTGERRWFLTRANPLRDAEGRIVRWVGVNTDIHDRKLAEAAAQAARKQEEASYQRALRSEERYRSLIRASGQTVWTADPAGQIDVPEGSDPARNWTESVHPEDRDRAMNAWQRAVETGVPFEAEFRLRVEGGRYLLAQARAVPILDPSGTVREWVGATADVTDARAIEDQLRYLADAGAALSSPQDASQTLRELCSLAVPRVADWAAIDLLGPDGQPQRVAVFHRDPRKLALADELWRKYPSRITDPSGLGAVLRTGEPELVVDLTEEMLRSLVTDPVQLELLLGLGLHSYVVVPIISRGTVLGALSTVLAESERRYAPHDVSFFQDVARRTAAALDNARLFLELSRAQTRATQLQGITAQLSRALTPVQVAQAAIGACRAALAANAVSVGVLDEQGERLVLLERELPQGADAANELRSISIDSALPMAQAVRTRALVWHSKLDEVERPELAALQLRHGYRGVGAVPLLYENRVVGALGVGFTAERDLLPEEQDTLTAIASQAAQALERARLYDEAEKARKAAVDANAAKDQFLAMLGHELRNPLAPIRTALQIWRLRGDVGGEKERAIIERQVGHMVRLVDDLLDVSRITRGMVELRRQKVELADVVARAVEFASPLLEQRRHHLELAVPQQGLVVDADPGRLTQVYANLLQNSAKYTPPGGRIELSARREGDEVVVVVRDNGQGISAELLPRVFDIFVQGHRGADRSEGGLGLGLALVKTLVAMHGGKVEAQSDGPGRGSTFVVRIPAAAALAVRTPSSPVARQSQPPLVRKRVLVVDDNTDAADLLGEALSSSGHECRVAYDGPSALAILRDFEPQVAFLDLGLPVMDGYELARKIRERPQAGPLRIYAITGYGQVSDHQRSREAGFSGHLVKPIDLSRLFRLLEQGA